MKYAMFDIETIGILEKDKPSYINIGDHFQSIIIKDLYREMNIADEDIYLLDYNQRMSYEGEYLLLPINVGMGISLKYTFSPKIIPVFLGISRSTTNIGEDELNYFRTYQPVGCRDERTFDLLTKHSVDCYLNGCLTITHGRREKQPTNGKVFLIEVPQFALDNMPASIKNSAEVLSNTFFGTVSALCQGRTMEQFIRERYQTLSEQATLVITSRLHIASPCIAMGIPTILIIEDIDYRFGWIDKYIPIYNKDNFSEVDWRPAVLDIEDIKYKLRSLAKMRITQAFNKFSANCEITEYYTNRKRSQYNLNDFASAALDFIKSKWSKDDVFNFSLFGGKNDISEAVYNYIVQNYPNANYYAFYDNYKHITYHGKPAQKSILIKPDDEEFIFVTGMTATEYAKNLFAEIGKPEDSYFLFNYLGSVR